MPSITPLSSSTQRRSVGFAFDPAATAAAIASALAMWNATAHPWSPAGSLADAIINEWIISFAALCVALMVVQAVLERLGAVRRRSVESEVADVREADDR